MIRLFQRVGSIGILTFLPVIAFGQAEPRGDLTFGVSQSSLIGTGGNISFDVEDVLLEGLAFQFGLRAASRGEAANVSLKYGWDLEEPLFGEATRVLTSLDVERQNFDIDDFSSTSLGVAVGLRTTLDPNLVLSTDIVLDYTELSDFSSDASPFIMIDEGSSKSAGFRLGLSYDTRPDTNILTPGFNADLSVYLPVVGDRERNFIPVDASVGFTQVVYGPISLRFAGAGGIVLADDDEAVHVLDRRFTAQGLPRGFEFGGAGPRDLTTDSALGGTRYLASSIEANAPVGTRGWVLGAFYDVGSVWDVTGVDSMEVREDQFFRSSFGLALTVPIGSSALRVVFAQPDRALETDRSDNISFSLNSNF